MKAEAPSVRDEMQAFYIRWRGEIDASHAAAREGALDNPSPALCAGLWARARIGGRGGGRQKVSRGASIL
jgi:hypothetical protein